MLNTKENREIWLKPFDENKALMNECSEKIEKYRKGYCKIRFTDQNGKPIAGKKVTLHQKKHDFKYGANIFMLDEFKNAEQNKKYRELFKEYFNLATVPFYWDGLEPEQGKPRFSKDSPKVYRRPAPELCVEYCEENGIDAKLHCLVYDKFTPDWLPKKDMEKMEQFYEERFRQIAERYTGRLMEIEVINETLCESGWNTQTVISEKRDVVEWAFALARKYFPGETLVINECNQITGTGISDYRSPYFMQIEKCLLKGATIDKIGLQHHVFTGASARSQEEYEKSVRVGSHEIDPNLMIKGLDIFSQFGLPMEITEVTFPTFGETEEDEDLQAEILKNVFTLWFSNRLIDTVVYWNTVDGYAYVNPADGKAGTYWNENQCRGGLFRHDLTPKKSALMLEKLFTEVWHTDLELQTDENGYVEFRGFYGEYLAELDGRQSGFGLHKNTECSIEIRV